MLECRTSDSTIAGITARLSCTQSGFQMERGGWGNDGTLKNVYRHAMEDQREKMSNKTNGHFDAMFNSL